MTTKPLLERLEAAAHEHGLSAAEIEASIERAVDAELARLTAAQILDDLRAATAERERADQVWHALLAAASAHGVSNRRVAEAAGVSPAWVGRLAKARNQQDTQAA